MISIDQSHLIISSLTSILNNDKSLLLVDYDLIDEIPILYFRNKAHREIFLKIKSDSEFKITLSQQKKCIGKRRSYEQHDFEKCVHNNVILKGKQCTTCDTIDLLNPCSRCQGVTCNANVIAREACMTPTIVYLVGFGDDLFKIGVSLKSRYRKRWLEQGAQMGTIIAEFPEGFLDPRKFENEISAFLNLPQRMTPNQKIQVLHRPVNEDLLNQLLNKLRNYSGSFSTYLDNDFDKITLFQPVGKQVSRYKLENHDEVLMGTINKMQGSLLIFTLERQSFAFSVKNLQGYTLSNFGGNIELQSSLDTFF